MGLGLCSTTARDLTKRGDWKLDGERGGGASRKKAAATSTFFTKKFFYTHTHRWHENILKFGKGTRVHGGGGGTILTPRHGW